MNREHHVFSVQTERPRDERSAKCDRWRGYMALIYIGDQNRLTAMAFQRTTTIFKIVDSVQSFVRLVLGYPQDPSENQILTNSS